MSAVFQTPSFFYRLSKATYKEDPAGYLQKKHVDAQCLESRDFGDGWRVCLFKENSSGKLVAAFRGTDSATNWADNVWRVWDCAIGRENPQQIQELHTLFAEFQQKYGKIDAVTGHSAGGYFADRVLPFLKDLLRVTFNGHAVKDGENRYNLSLSSDRVSGVPFLADKDAYVCVGEGGHRLKEFKPYINDLTFEKLDVWKQRPSGAFPGLILGEKRSLSKFQIDVFAGSISGDPENINYNPKYAQAYKLAAPVLKNQPITDETNQHLLSIALELVDGDFAAVPARSLLTDAKYQLEHPNEPLKVPSNPEQVAAAMPTIEQVLEEVQQITPQVQKAKSTLNKQIITQVTMQIVAGTAECIDQYFQMQGQELRRKIQEEAYFRQIQYQQEMLGTGFDIEQFRHYPAPQIQRHIERCVCPETLVRDVDQIEAFAAVYKSQVEQLKSQIARRKELVEQGKIVKQDLDVLDRDIMRSLRKARASYSKWSKAIGIASKVLAIAGGVAATIATGGGALAAAMPFIECGIGLGQTGLGIGSAKLEANRDKSFDRKQQLLEHNGNERGLLNQMAQKNAMGIGEVYSRLEHLQRIATEHPELFNPTQVIDCYNEHYNDLCKDESQLVEERRHNRDVEFPKEESTIKRLENEIKNLQWEKGHGADKKRRKKIDEEVLKKQGELAEWKRKNLERCTWDQELEEKLASIQDQKIETKEGLERETRLKALSEYHWSWLQQNKQELTKAQLELRTRFDVQMNEVRNQIIADGYQWNFYQQLYGQVARQLYQWFGTVKPLQVNAICGALLQSYGLFKEAREAWKRFQVIKKENCGGEWNKAIADFGWNRFISSILEPGSGSLFLILDAINLTCGLFQQPQESELFHFGNELLKQMNGMLGSYFEQMHLHINELQEISLANHALSNEIKERVESMSSELISMESEITERLKAMEKRLGDKIDQSSAVQYEQRIHDHWNQFQTEENVRQARIYLANGGTTKWVKGYAEALKDFIGSIYTPDLSGVFAMGKAAPMTYQGAHPEFFTGAFLPGIAPNSSTKIPNLHLLGQAAKQFFALIEKLEKNNQLRAQSKQLKPALEAIDHALTYCAGLTEFLPYFVENAVQEHQKLMTPTRLQQEMQENLCHQSYQTLLNERWKWVEKNREQITEKDFAGDQRFLLSRALQTPRGDLKFNEQQILEAIRWKMRGEAAKDLVFWSAQRDKNSSFWDYGGALLGNLALNYVTIGLFSIIMTATYVKEGDRGVLDRRIRPLLASIHAGMEGAINQISCNRNILSVIHMDSNLFGIEVLAQRIYDVSSRAFDSYDRIKIDGETKKGEYPLNSNKRSICNLTHTVEYEDHMAYRTQFDQNSIIQKKHLKKIPEVDLNQAEQKAEKLKEWLKIYCNSNSPSCDLPEPLRKGSMMIPPAQEGLIPLAFPKKWMEAWEAQLKIRTGQTGIFIPQYSFTEQPLTHSYRLDVHFVYTGATGSFKPFGKVTVAEFDADTVDAFRTFHEGKEGVEIGEPHLNELLAQSMYAHLIPESGMPDDTTYRLQQKIVAAHDSPFPGLYQLLEKAPLSMINFECAQNTRELRDSLNTWLHQGEPSPLVGKLLPETNVVLSKEAGQIQRLIRSQHAESPPATYEKAYHLLLGVAKLGTEMPVNELQTVLEESLGLPYPEDSEALKEHMPRRSFKDFQAIVKGDPSNWLKLKELCNTLQRKLA